MLFNYEFKKVWRRVSPLAVLIILLVTSILTVTLTACFFNNAPANTATDAYVKYEALATKINNWNTKINRQAFADAFDKFYTNYKKMNASTLDGKDLVENYNKANESFQAFYADYYQKYIYNGSENKITDYLLIQSKYADSFNSILEKLDEFFTANYTTGTGIISGLKKTNSAWEDADLQTVLDNLFFVQTIHSTDLNDLKNFFTNQPTNNNYYDYTDAYDYVLNRYWLAIASSSSYTGDLSQYEGFTEFKDIATSTKACKLAEYRLEHKDTDYTKPFSFGKIHLENGQVSLFDFVFTNLEMAMFFIVILTMIWTASAFFTDKYQSTLITPIAAGKKRSTVIVTKISVVLVFAVLTLLAYTIIYLTLGLIFFKAYISPDVLFLLNGTTPSVMSSANYFALYFLSLTFKLLPLIAVCGLFSFIKSKPFLIIGLTILVYAIVIVLNFYLGNFGFYQFVPLLGLDPIRYCGAELFLSPMPTSYNFWYTFPAMLSITTLLYLWLILKFRRHDFY